MSKILTIVCLLMVSSACFATQQTHVITLQLVESMLWHEGITPHSQVKKEVKEQELSEELSVALENLDY